ncbi:MAG TPA: M14 family metallopeptidase [Lacibacter sp.]|nr:M14 family metallopeptidase [Lacibacter sp.]HMO90026.1 M14 family metallopeptidase [Lacibacter sp.]
MKQLLAAGFFFLLTLAGSAQVMSPEQFLGYPLGSRYTPHHKIVAYVQHVAAQSPQMVRLEQYGVTNEHRPLLALFVSAPENIRRLEEIRLNNLRLASLLPDKAAATEETPVIVWLSYNVHGNETSSSEAALMTLYALVDPSNTKTREWLRNTVVVMDPCINPDGRDRYINWYNSVLGVQPTARMDAREHREPWPGGRTNHYNFDLNRDWAWQTQVESRQRLVLYNKWMPQIHVDYHEQGINSPYYFAPAAEPYHEVITPWQRSFQETIGRNHARYFDDRGWLYFTKLRFDLFYPSYGDTYPTYNGAIGMTYEQGGIGAGLLAVNSDGDTLTLTDRVLHHYTTGISTIETASNHARKLVQEFRAFFNKALTTGYGSYKTYVIKNNPRDAQRIRALLGLLHKNGIQYGTATGSGRGYNYLTGKEEAFTMGGGDIVVSALQPRSALVQVLFEPRSALSDSATYDITAWSLPYAYGLTAWASRDRINPLPYPQATPVANSGAAAYAYVIKWEGVQSARAAGYLLQKGVLLRYSEIPFAVNGQQFDRGSLIVAKTSNQKTGDKLWQYVKEACDRNGLYAYPVSTGMVDEGGDFGSDLVNSMKLKRVVLLTGEGTNANAVGAIWHFFDQQLNYPVTLVNVSDYSRINWQETDVLIMADGNYRFLGDKTSADGLRDWISKGGRVVALENAVTAFARLDWGLKVKKTEETEKKDIYSPLRSYENRERDYIMGMTPGSIYKVDLDNTHPLAWGFPAYYYTLKQDDQIYEFMAPGTGWNTGVIKKEAQLAGFVGSKLKQRLQDGLLFGTQQMGRGSVVYLADDVLFRSFWENGKLLLCNAVLF